ncbi:two-component system, NarL family, response regulator NreC [Filimonas lacunae]|uniref:Two-component system, NarL family, response regulator NreC n=1 Tax=Filimonas lacunae TaxID=477680 RepID=A0A173MJ78_9BACT|nr:helix-turn-helix transcriptional regulator [Filimonas lacunae]BAV07448.1 two-component transcriptional regulator, LuxR family [Filimonas lacunae]SIT30332.1 two-component system, NarL family, response regulator NreC [Filimonas lacunae]
MMDIQVYNRQQRLSRRESEILRLVALGLTSDKIAAQLFVSRRTVENHRANIRRKLDAQNTAGMLHKAMQERLL